MTPRQTIDALIEKYDADLKRAFLDSVAQIRSEITLADIIDALENGDVQRAIDAMNIEVAAYHRLDMAMVEAFNSGGQSLVTQLPKRGGLVFRWGMRNTPAEMWLREHSSALITRIVEDQVAAVRSALVGGLERGRNPRVTAIEIVGRVSRASGRREGGVLGLSEPGERAVARAREELETGDYSAYFNRKRRDKRFDRTISSAAKSGKPLNQETIGKITARYSDRLLETRGETIARLETMTAISQSRHDAMTAQIAAGKIVADDVSKIWHTVRDDRVRHTHRLLNGKSVLFDGVFQASSGAMLRFPCDPQAPLSERAGCRCWLEYKVDYFAKLEREAA